MPITQIELAQRIKLALDLQSNDSNVNPVTARAVIADEIAQAINDFIIGRLTVVTGASSDGSTITGQGIIQ